MLGGSGTTTPHIQALLTDLGRKDTQGSGNGGDQFNQSFGPENSFQQEAVISSVNNQSKNMNVHGKE